MTTDQSTNPSTLPVADPAEVERARQFFESQQAEAAAPTPADPAPISTSYVERVEEVAAGVHGAPNLTAIDHLIEEAKSKLGAGIIDTSVDHPWIEADDAAMLNALSAERGSLDRQIKMLTERKASIDDLAKGILGDAHDLKANGATVVTYRPSVSRTLNQEQVKKHFPDTAENAELWKDTETRRINWT